MNAIDLLKQDHRIVDTLFKRIENTSPSKHKDIFERIRGELETHAHVEEVVFYPAVKRTSKELKDLVLEGLEEHSQIKKFLSEIGRSRKDEVREAKLKVLIEDTRHHVKEEESEMFPKVEDNFEAEALEKLGARMEKEKEKFQRANGITPENREEYKGVFEAFADKAKQVATALFSDNGGSKRTAGKTVKKATAKADNGTPSGRSTPTKKKVAKGPAKTTPKQRSAAKSA